jgi:hypothetical protein
MKHVMTKQGESEMNDLNNRLVVDHIDNLRHAGAFGEFESDMLSAISDGLDALGEATTFVSIAEALDDIDAFTSSVSYAGSNEELVKRLNRLASYDPDYFEKATDSLLTSLRKALDK